MAERKDVPHGHAPPRGLCHRPRSHARAGLISAWSLHRRRVSGHPGRAVSVLRPIEENGRTFGPTARLPEQSLEARLSHYDQGRLLVVLAERRSALARDHRRGDPCPGGRATPPALPPARGARPMDGRRVAPPPEGRRARVLSRARYRRAHRRRHVAPRGPTRGARRIWKRQPGARTSERRAGRRVARAVRA